MFERCGKSEEHHPLSSKPWNTMPETGSGFVSRSQRSRHR